MIYSARSRDGEVVTPPRKSLPLRAIDLSALPQGEGWAAFVAPLSRSGPPYQPLANPAPGPKLKAP